MGTEMVAGTAAVRAAGTGDDRASVLIVDQSDESREVLRTVLARRGVDILEASEPQQGLDLARRHHPRVIVLDLEAVPPEDELLRAGFDGESQAHDAQLLLLGNVGGWPTRPAGGEMVPKPYHYAPLIRKIEELLQLPPAAVRRT